MRGRGDSACGVSDAELIARSRGNPGAFGELFERHFDDVYRYLARRIGVERADDLASQTFVAAFERRHTFDSQLGQVRGWLLGIATNLLWNERRSERRLLGLSAQMQSQHALDFADPGTDRWQIDGALATALLKLDGDQRDVLLLTAWGELSYEEIAAALSVPVGTVRSRLSRARSQLRAELQATKRAVDGDRSEELT